MIQSKLNYLSELSLVQQDSGPLVYYVSNSNIAYIQDGSIVACVLNKYRSSDLRLFELPHCWCVT